MEQVIRPEASNKKIHSKEDFELCYIRHQYFRRSKVNPTEEELRPYMAIVTKFAKNTFFTYKNLFLLVGLHLDDVINIGRVHLVSFMGLYTLEQQPNKMADFTYSFWKKNNKIPSEFEILSKNRANLTMFIRQRMEDVVRVSRQKAKNVKGLAVDEYYVYYGPHVPPDDLRLILEDNEREGFRKLDVASFKTIKRKMKIKGNGPFQFAGYWYVAIPLEHRNLRLDDLSTAGYDPYDSIHNKNPEQLMIEKVREDEFEQKKAAFKARSKHGKATVMRNFIEKHESNPMFAEEVRLARKFLNKLRM